MWEWSERNPGMVEFRCWRYNTCSIQVDIGAQVAHLEINFRNAVCCPLHLKGFVLKLDGYRRCSDYLRSAWKCRHHTVHHVKTQVTVFELESPLVHLEFVVNSYSWTILDCMHSVWIHIDVSMNQWMNVSLYQCIYVSMYRCSCVSIYQYIYISTYLCIYTSLQLSCYPLTNSITGLAAGGSWE